jgi:hypothetical protein
MMSVGHLPEFEVTMKKHIIMLALITRWEPGVAATIGGAAGLTAGIVGYDPWTWIIGGFGAAVVYVKRPARSHWDAVINSGISVGIGGLVAPALAGYLAAKWDVALGNPHPWAFILSSAWPWLVPIATRKLRDLKPEELGK